MGVYQLRNFVQNPSGNSQSCPLLYSVHRTDDHFFSERAHAQLVEFLADITFIHHQTEVGSVTDEKKLKERQKIKNSGVTMSLFVIRYDYDTIITKNRDYRYDFDYSSKPVVIDAA